MSHSLIVRSTKNVNQPKKICKDHELFKLWHLFPGDFFWGPKLKFNDPPRHLRRWRPTLAGRWLLVPKSWVKGVNGVNGQFCHFSIAFTERKEASKKKDMEIQDFTFYWFLVQPFWGLPGATLAGIRNIWNFFLMNGDFFFDNFVVDFWVLIWHNIF